MNNPVAIAGTALPLPDIFYRNQLAYDSSVSIPMGHEYITDQSPLGMDLGEFMHDGDMEFLNQFAWTQASHNISFAIPKNGI
jgi:hypothetical protein